MEPSGIKPGAQKNTAPPRRRGAFGIGGFVLTVSALCIGGVIALLLRSNADPGFRVWMLNHAPDQAIIINPFNGQVEKKFLVADGLKELAFTPDYRHAWIANVVDVSNRIKEINTKTFLTEDEIEVDGVPQGIGAFPDDGKLAVILGSKTDFMAGGFDVLDLKHRSAADPRKRVRLYRERDLSLTHKIAVGDDGDRIYCIDAKKPLVNIFSLKAKGRVGAVDLHGSPEELLYPRQGKYYYVSVLQHYAVYQIDKATDQISAAYVSIKHDPRRENEPGKVEYIALSAKGDYLFASELQIGAHVYVWHVGDPDFKIMWKQVDPKELPLLAGLPSVHNTQEQYLPATDIKLKGGYDPGIEYVPAPERLGVDALDQNVFVVDEKGALYIYNFPDVVHAREGAVITPYKLVQPVKDAEVRDMKVSQPARGG